MLEYGRTFHHWSRHIYLYRIELRFAAPAPIILLFSKHMSHWKNIFFAHLALFELTTIFFVRYLFLGDT